MGLKANSIHDSLDYCVGHRGLVGLDGLSRGARLDFLDDRRGVARFDHDDRCARVGPRGVHSV